jgi:20S proteasome alpha/beta subunit
MLKRFPLTYRLPSHRTKPYIRPIPRSPMERAKSMTIVAGFHCTDGVLLAADTLISFEGTDTKTYDSKIFRINPELDIYLTYAGDPDFAKEYVCELAEATAGKTEVEALALADQISKKLWKMWYVAPAKGDKSWAHMLLTILEKSSVSLYSIRGMHFTKADKYAALGIGFPQAEAFLNTYYRNWMNLRQAEYMARYALYHVKKFVNGCGGDTEIQQVGNDGLFRFRAIKQVSLISSNETEEDFAFLDREILPLLISFCDLQVNKKAFRQQLRKLSKTLEAQRTERFEQAPKIFDKFIQRTG